MNELALFAGAGGGILGGILCGFKTVAAVEIDDYCSRVLIERQRDSVLPWFPIWDDVRTFDGKPWRGIVDVVTAGFPCQPFSVAGKQKADADERNMWPDTLRIIGEVRPEWCLLENVPGLLSPRHGYFGEILRGLAEIGYDARWGIISAAGCGAPHLRKRLWIVAHAEGEQSGRIQQFWIRSNTGTIRKNMADAIGKRLEKRQGERIDNGPEFQAVERSGDYHNARKQWPPEPGVGRVADGVAHRVDRLKALGNGQVPRVAATAWERLSR